MNKYELVVVIKGPITGNPVPRCKICNMLIKHPDNFAPEKGPITVAELMDAADKHITETHKKVIDE